MKLLELKEKSIEFDVRRTLIKTKNWRPDGGRPATYIRRIKVEDFGDFACFEYTQPSQIIHFDVYFPEDLERVKEELKSLNSLRRIALRFPCYLMIPRGFFEAILTKAM